MHQKGQITRILLLTVAWLALVAAAVLWGVGEEQANLKADAVAELADAGIELDNVKFEGRDAVLTGPESVREEAEALIGAIRGVRDVRWDTPREASAGRDGSTTTSPTTSATTVTTLPLVDDEPTEAGVPFLGARLETGHLTVRGAIPDEAAASRLAATADRIYAPLFNNELVVDDTLESAPWVARASDVIAALPVVGTADLQITGTEATLVGFAPDEAALAELRTAVEAALGPDVTLTTDVEVTSLAPPTLEGAVTDDGVLTIEGTVASSEVADSLRGLLAAAFGEENVVGELTISDDVDTTFGLFRLASVCALFQPHPHWHFAVTGNELSGEIRGGLFPTAQAQLTPEIIHLLPAVVTLMQNNPSLSATILGHTDDIGPLEMNQRLSDERAMAGYDFMLGSGIAPDRLTAVGYADARPIDDNETAVGREQNRRIEFTFTTEP